MKQQTWQYLAVRSVAALVAAASFSSWGDAVPSFSQVPALQGDASICLGKEDGSYAHPDCRVRYACERSVASQVDCPSGQVFDKNKNRDDDPAQSYCAVPESASHVDCSEVKLLVK
jgi:hypothetical protein